MSSDVQEFLKISLLLLFFLSCVAAIYVAWIKGVIEIRKEELAKKNNEENIQETFCIVADTTKENGVKSVWITKGEDKCQMTH